MKIAILFVVWPYVAFAILVVGFVGRWLLLRRGPSADAQPLPAPRVPVRRVVWFLLIAAHALGILLPGAVLAWNAVAWRLYALEGLGFLIGLAALAMCAMAIWRAFVPVERTRTLRRAVYPGLRPARSAASEISDVAFVSVLLTGVGSGLALAVLYRWGSSWGAVTLAPYMVSMSQGSPRPELVADMPFLIRLHVFTAFAAMALFPFTSAALAAMVAARRALSLRDLPATVKRWRSEASRRT